MWQHPCGLRSVDPGSLSCSADAGSTPSPIARALLVDEVLAGYDRASSLYPNVPPLSLWRAWEVAAYARYRLLEPVLDVGCGDGVFFRLLWPEVRRVTGVDQDPVVAQRARACGIYERVLDVPAAAIPREEAGYRSAFANCSLEHMDDLDGVLACVHRALVPGGHLLCSVVTDRFISWLSLAPVISRAAGSDRGEAVRDRYLRYHHLVNALSVDAWIARFLAAGFVVREHVPILPEVTARAFLALDEIWHLLGLDGSGGELGGHLEGYFQQRAGFASAFRHVIRGLLEMEKEHDPACGAVFLAERTGNDQ